MYQYDYQDDVYYELPNCPCCEENMQKVDSAANFLEKIVEQLYGKEKLNLDKLDEDLEEICHYLGVKIRRESLNITRCI